MSRLRVSITTIGCRANQSDSAWLGRALDPERIEVVEAGVEADVHVINSCAVTLSAERDARKAINRARRTSGEDARILLTGCMVTASEAHVAELDRLWEVVPSTERASIPRLLANLSVALGASALSEDGAQGFGPVPTALRRMRPSLRVQDGCPMSCAYCAVPLGRGAIASMPPEQVLRRLDILADEGAQEVVICGINLGAWGKDLTPRQGLVDLVRRLEQEAPVKRIRLSSIEPWALVPTLIEVLAASTRIAPHLHLPLQSGDDEVLRTMNRPFRAERFVSLIERLIDARKDIAIGTDVMAGFPGEDERAFKRTLGLLESLPLAYLHAFGFSPRPGTRAASLPGRVPHEELKRRVSALRDLGSEKRHRFAVDLIGQVVRPLFERALGTGQLRGTSGRFVSVLVDGPESLINRIVDVRVKTATMEGQITGQLLTVD